MRHVRPIGRRPVGASFTRLSGGTESAGTACFVFSGIPAEGEVLAQDSRQASTVPGDRPVHACIGATLGGRYLVKQLLGEGGMGCVYEGEHVGLGRGVAIKIMHANFSANRDVVERFRREAQSASALENQHVVDVLDVDSDERFGLYMVMELLRGHDLSATLKKARSFSPRVACAIVAQTADALAAAHTAGIVHRDLKPANLFLVDKPDGSVLVKLLDFSVAKIARAAVDNAASQITRAGSALGTPQYMAPEQAQGTQIDHRVDIYALGAVLYELVVGRPARAPKPSYELMIVDVITQPAPRPRESLPDLPEKLDNLIGRMMSQDRERRPRDMDEVLGALLELYPDLATTRLMVSDGGTGESHISLFEAGANADLFSTTKRSQYHLQAVSSPPPSLFGPASIRTPHDLVVSRRTGRRLRYGGLIALGIAALVAGAIATWFLSSPGDVEVESESESSDKSIIVEPASGRSPGLESVDPAQKPATVTPATPAAVTPADAAVGPESATPVGTGTETAGKAAPTAAKAQEKPHTDAPTRGGTRAPPRRKSESQVGGTGVAEEF